MQETKHVIAHRPEAVNKGEIPLSIDQADHHLGYLETDIEHCLSERDIDVSVNIVEHEAHISLRTNSDAVNLDNELGLCLAKINGRTAGLAFVKVD
jgi:hypothetical protein